MRMDYQDEIRYISTRIKELRKERSLTVQELAYRCDIKIQLEPYRGGKDQSDRKNHVRHL